MYFLRKLKPPGFNTETYLGIAFGLLFLFFLAFFSIYIALGFGSIVLFGYTIVIGVVYLNNRNQGYLVLFITMFIDALFCASVAAMGFGGNKIVPTVLAFFVIICSIFLFFMIANRRLKWRTREILELAAMPVKEISNGFTTRPHPAGKSNYTREEILAFARFLHAQLIAIPFIEEERIVLSISSPLSRQMGINKRYQEGSWIAFDFKGNITVMMSQEDYQLYKDAYAFDQLNDQLGKVFINFLELFKQGQGARILDQLNALRLNPIIE